LKSFESINKGYNSTFIQNQLTLGLVIPIENHLNSAVPTLQDHLQRVQLAEKLGFKAVWVRDVPMHVPSFGDAGQTYDPFTYLGYLAGLTSEIALGTASIALPLHHPLHVAKSATTIDQLSGGRLLLGVASGDRPSEYPAMGIDFESRGEQFRDAYQYIRDAEDSFPITEPNRYGQMDGRADILPKSTTHKIPMLITGHSQQNLEWVVQNGDGWMYYPRNLYMQGHNISEWRNKVIETQEYDKPFMQSLYVDLQKDDDFKPVGIHLGFKIGMNYLIDFITQLRAIGVNHVAINLRLHTGSIEEAMQRMAEVLMPHFHNHIE